MRSIICTLLILFFITNCFCQDRDPCPPTDRYCHNTIIGNSKFLHGCIAENANCAFELVVTTSIAVKTSDLVFYPSGEWEGAMIMQNFIVAILKCVSMVRKLLPICPFSPSQLFYLEIARFIKLHQYKPYLCVDTVYLFCGMISLHNCFLS